MRHGLAWLCVVGGVLVVGMTQGGAPKPVKAGIDKATQAEVRKLQEKRRDLLRQLTAAPVPSGIVGSARSWSALADLHSRR
jgi:hypothetical protein